MWLLNSLHYLTLGEVSSQNRLYSALITITFSACASFFPLQPNSRGLRWCQQLHHCQPDSAEGSGLSSSGQCWPKPGDHPAPELHHSLRQPEHGWPQHRQLRVAAQPQQQRKGDGDAGQCRSPVFHLDWSLAGFLSVIIPVLMDC